MVRFGDRTAIIGMTWQVREYYRKLLELFGEEKLLAIPRESKGRGSRPGCKRNAAAVEFTMSDHQHLRGRRFSENLDSRPPWSDA